MTCPFGLFWCLQRDNVRNQREHLTLLLANVHIRLNPKPEPLNKVCSIFMCQTITTLYSEFFYDFSVRYLTPVMNPPCKCIIHFPLFHFNFIFERFLIKCLHMCVILLFVSAIS